MYILREYMYSYYLNIKILVMNFTVQKYIYFLNLIKCKNIKNDDVFINFSLNFFIFNVNFVLQILFLFSKFYRTNEQFCE